MILAAKYARENRVPYFGICLGMQIAVIEFARNVLGVKGATSQEFAGSESDDNVVVFMPEIDKTQMGGTMRLGSRATVMDESKGDKCRLLYKNAGIIHERHRHRYEINPAYVDRLQAAGLEFVGQDEAGVRMMTELKGHPYFVASQFHPKYKTRPLRPTPLFLGFVLASAGLWDEYAANGSVKGESDVMLGKYPSKADLLEEITAGVVAL
jgi:CTP synthase